MTSTLFIAQRELKSYFNSRTAYTVVTMFLTIVGGIFWLGYFQPVRTELSLRGFFSAAPLFMAFFVPAITMGLIAEEKRSGTLEMLMTLPVRDGEVVFGKFLAAMALIGVTLLVTLAYPLTLNGLASPNAPMDWGPVWGGYAGLMLLGGAYAAIGIMVSSWHKDQVNSILISFFLCFLLHMLGPISNDIEGSLGDLLWFLSTSGHFENVARGVIDVRDVVYYVSVVVIGLSLATVTLSARRW